VNQVVPLAELILKDKEMAESILKSGPTAIRLAMDLLLRRSEMSLDHSMAFESAMTSVSLDVAGGGPAIKAKAFFGQEVGRRRGWRPIR